MLPHRWHKLYKNVLLQLQIFSSHVPTRILTRSVFSQFPQRPIYRHRYWIDLWSLPYKLKLIAAFVLVPNHLLLLCSFGGKIKKKMKEVRFYSYIRLPARLFFFHPRPSLCLSAELEEASHVLFISSQRILFGAVFLVLTQNQLERFEVTKTRPNNIGMF